MFYGGSTLGGVWLRDGRGGRCLPREQEQPKGAEQSNHHPAEPDGARLKVVIQQPAQHRADALPKGPGQPEDAHVAPAHVGGGNVGNIGAGGRYNGIAPLDVKFPVK